MLSMTVPPCVLDEVKVTILKEIKEAKKSQETLPKFDVGNYLFRREVRKPDTEKINYFD